MEATTAAVESSATPKSTAMEATSAHAASVSTAAATTSVTATTTTTTTTAAATSECRGWLNQADRCQREQGNNRFPHRASLRSVTPEEYNTFAAGLFGDQTAFAVN
jgi:hypothetical protein